MYVDARDTCWIAALRDGFKPRLVNSGCYGYLAPQGHGASDHALKIKVHSMVAVLPFAWTDARHDSVRNPLR